MSFHDHWTRHQFQLPDLAVWWVPYFNTGVADLCSQGGQGHVRSKMADEAVLLLRILPMLAKSRYIARNMSHRLCLYFCVHSWTRTFRKWTVAAVPQHLGTFCKHFTTPVYDAGCVTDRDQSGALSKCCRRSDSLEADSESSLISSGLQD